MIYQVVFVAQIHLFLAWAMAELELSMQWYALDENPHLKQSRCNITCYF
jgi:hypothetical protein